MNRQTGQWGTQYDPAQDLLSVPLERLELSEEVDRFTIVLESPAETETESETEARVPGRLVLSWGRLALTARFAID